MTGRFGIRFNTVLKRIKMTHPSSSAVVRLAQWTTFAFLIVICKAGWTQSVDDVLTKCRATVESISSYEYSASSTSTFGHETQFFFARVGDAYRYDQRVDLPEQIGRNLPDERKWHIEFKAGFDGLYYYEYDRENQIEKICSPPTRMQSVIEPFQGSFCWLTRTNSRSEILKKSRWEVFAKSCEDLVSKQQIEGHLCSVVTTRPGMEGFRYEVAFGEDVGYLPVRVRTLRDDEKRTDGELVLAGFKHFRIDGVSVHFPTQFNARALVKRGEQPNWYVTTLKQGTLNVNLPISNDLLRLQYNPIVRNE